ncbi:MAG TPA: hypothetical protein VIU13_14840, partial [Chryseolinea sp.]
RNRSYWHFNIGVIYGYFSIAKSSGNQPREFIAIRIAVNDSNCGQDFRKQKSFYYLQAINPEGCNNC